MSNPAAISEAAVVGVIFPVASPICVATITNVSVVACSRPAAAVRAEDRREAEPVGEHTEHRAGHR